METLFCFVMFGLCIAGIGMIAWELFLLILGNTVSIGVVLLGIISLGLALLMFYLWDKKIHKDYEVTKNWLSSMYKSDNVKGKEIFKITTYPSSTYIIYFDDKKLFYIDEEKKVFNKIPLDKILKVDIQAKTKEKTKQEILTLTPTFHTDRIILLYYLNIITETETVNLIVPPKDGARDLLERFRLILERDIKEL